MTRISTGDLRKNLADTINRAGYARNRIVVERNGKPIVAIVPIDDLRALEAIEDAADARAADQAKSEGGASAWKSSCVNSDLPDRATRAPASVAS